MFVNNYIVFIYYKNLIMDDSQDNIELKNEGNRLYLVDLSDNLTVEIDFIKQIESLRGKNINSENLIKALGKLSDNSVIYDLTAGLGRDALILALKGYRVVMLEKQPMLQQMLENALKQLKNSEYKDIASRLELVKGDSKFYLKELPKKEGQVFYFDPMFPKRSKSAKVKKDLQILQKICTIDDDIEELLNMAKQKGKTILKRPKTAFVLDKIKPHHIIAGSKVNFLVF